MREWIITNGIGGYASLTHSNQNTSKFHGLLVSSLNPPTKRWVFVTNILDIIQYENKTIFLNNLKPKFEFDFFPTFAYTYNGLKIKKIVFMPYQQNTTIIRYEIESSNPFIIYHHLLINSRHFYETTHPDFLTFDQICDSDSLKIRPSNVDKEIKILLKDASYSVKNQWKKYFYEKDKERKDIFNDNNFNPGEFCKKHSKGKFEYYMILTTEEKIDEKPDDVYLSELKRKRELLHNANLPTKFDKLILNADNFIVKKQNEKSIVAGYHWFGEWGRDTLISLPGLTLVTNRFKDANQILLSYSKYCKKGLIPNVFTDKNSKAFYNNVDSSLWYIDRVYQYLKYTHDIDFLEIIWKTLESIINAYVNGTNYNIHMDEDYLISHGPGLTWMDIKIGNYYPTPRARKAVEIQALWYNALTIMSKLSEIIGVDDNYFIYSEKVKQNFNRLYDKNYDVIDEKDESIRPNQIFLVSLDNSMVELNLQKKIVEKIKKNLHTVFGLRTLSRKNDKYIGNYIGYHNKDEAYHNGTVWPWLLGPFITSYIKVNGKNSSVQKYAYTNFITPMIAVFGQTWDGSVYEIFDGDPPYIPRGCINQAWSVAEILRAWVEDIEQIRPKFEKYFNHLK